MYVGADNEKNGETCGVDVDFPACLRACAWRACLHERERACLRACAVCVPCACRVRGRHHDGECEDEKGRKHALSPALALFFSPVNVMGDLIDQMSSRFL